MAAHAQWGLTVPTKHGSPILVAIAFGVVAPVACVPGLGAVSFFAGWEKRSKRAQPGVCRRFLLVVVVALWDCLGLVGLQRRRRRRRRRKTQHPLVYP